MATQTPSLKRAIYAGSFDPITNGHLDIVHRALSVVDELIIGVIYNPEKTGFFSVEERQQLILESTNHHPQITIKGFQGLLIDFANQQNITTLIRGLRAVSDFDYEFQMALTNRRLNPHIDTVFLMTDQEYSFLSSSLVKQVAQFGGDVSQFVPSSVRQKLEEKFL